MTKRKRVTIDLAFIGATPVHAGLYGVYELLDKHKDVLNITEAIGKNLMWVLADHIDDET